MFKFTFMYSYLLSVNSPHDPTKKKMLLPPCAPDILLMATERDIRCFTSAIPLPVVMALDSAKVVVIRHEYMGMSV